MGRVRAGTRRPGVERSIIPRGRGADKRAARETFGGGAARGRGRYRRLVRRSSTTSSATIM